MSFLTAIILGLVQGIAEFLPISSSGHLSILQHFMGLTNVEQNYLLFDVLLHLGTLISIFIIYFHDIIDLIKDFFALIADLISPQKNQKKEVTPNDRMVLMLIVATLPLFLILPMKDKVESLYSNMWFVGSALLVTGVLLFMADRMSRGRKTDRTGTILDSLLVGVGQALAVSPGLSRSGTTIAFGMMRGFDRNFAVRFSFLLSIPAVLGANILSLIDAIKAGIDVSLLPMYLVGMVVAAVSGYFAITLVKLLARKGKFGSFAYYCWAVGVITIISTAIFG